MPYIPQADRMAAFIDPKTPGELNYAITQLCLDWLKDQDGRYADHATVIGALECAKLEFYRRALAPYEDLAAQNYGDVY